MRLGASAYLRKPVDEEILLGAIRLAVKSLTDGKANEKGSTAREHPDEFGEAIDQEIRIVTLKGRGRGRIIIFKDDGKSKGGIMTSIGLSPGLLS